MLRGEVGFSRQCELGTTRFERSASLWPYDLRRDGRGRLGREGKRVDCMAMRVENDEFGGEGVRCVGTEVVTWSKVAVVGRLQYNSTTSSDSDE